jgi:hypothetical protein
MSWIPAGTVITSVPPDSLIVQSPAGSEGEPHFGARAEFVALVHEAVTAETITPISSILNANRSFTIDLFKTTAVSEIMPGYS